MEPMHAPDQTGNQDPRHRNEHMNAKQENAQIESAPLYASPWLAFFYLIRQGLGQLKP